MTSGTVLVVDDERNTRIVLKKLLAGKGYEVDVAEDGEEALRWLKVHQCDVMLIDYKMPGLNGVEVCRKVRELYPDITPIIVTAHGTIDTAVRAMREGAYDYLTKPVNPDELLMTLAKTLEHRKLEHKVEELRREVTERYQFHNIVAKSKVMQEVFTRIEKASGTDVTVFVQGETGTGKELVARAIHFNSPRKSGPLVALNCISFQENVLESELFGHVEGAFTGAIRDKPGRFEMADRGTLFLDEIDLIPPNVQAKLLRVLEEKKFERVGGTNQIEVDIRLISCTNRNLREEVANGGFREDLFHRINVLPIQLPPLRDRREDIPLLVNHFLEKANRTTDKRIRMVSPAAMQRFFLYSWPGNVRELENAIDSSVVLCDGDTIELKHLPPTLATEAEAEAPPSGADNIEEMRLPDNVDMFERHLIIQALAKSDQNTTAAASLLGISPRTLRNKIQKHRLRSV